MYRILLALFAAWALCSPLLGKSSLRIAVASNFHPTLVQIAAAYQESHPDTELTLIPGSSGKLYAQIANGATFDAFFSADSERPQKLENAGIALADTRFTFALGILAFWQPGSPAADLSKTQTLALANPKLAPFGLAATQARDSLPFPPHRSVTASSVSQAFTFAQSGAADSAFVSYSQLRQLEIPAAEYILIDPERYAPIEQQAIALKASHQLLEFLAYCQSPEAQATIAAAGYRVP
ncbi:molybdate ABC transporter substrate-binding protein [Pelagicoccus sp. SDUM812005]|uniref:molybdate ABC transporter substrate-binding protein n=1 Tax=Pelagicoccus sp. SDUM812005 TaxID=3041257 RepID=UPI00280D25C2|nr:molybdate ABC transporter substrate-binding protein [Pelagicoccus sp. SDUM812005]MDQ8183346.1 molybdate ABC transporter substrate-binding protein [Pelagicoccus sp. SDUM812005]